MPIYMSGWFSKPSYLKAMSSCDTDADCKDKSTPKCALMAPFSISGVETLDDSVANIQYK